MSPRMQGSVPCLDLMTRDVVRHGDSQGVMSRTPSTAIVVIWRFSIVRCYMVLILKCCVFYKVKE